MLLACAYLVIINVAAFAAFGWDKQRAVAGGRRVPERTLLNLAALGGSPGAFAAQRLFRHKVSKRPFQRAFRSIVALQVAALLLVGWLILRPH